MVSLTVIVTVLLAFDLIMAAHSHSRRQLNFLFLWGILAGYNVALLARIFGG